jgi:hypothetical protein
LLRLTQLHCRRYFGIDTTSVLCRWNKSECQYFKTVSRRFRIPFEVHSVSVRHVHSDCPYKCITVVLPEKKAKVFDLFSDERRKWKLLLLLQDYTGSVTRQLVQWWSIYREREMLTVSWQILLLI